GAEAITAADDRSERLSSLPMPVPLAAPAIGVLAGVALSDALPAPPRWLPPLLAGLTVALLAIVIVRASRMRSIVRSALLALAAAVVGLLRHQGAITLPPDHIAHLASAEGRLTRIAGVIVTEPTSRPAERRNPFLH